MSELWYIIKYIDTVSDQEKRDNMPKESVDFRKEEIINACEKLYETNTFKDITMKSIGEETTFSRTSIYNYFQTKEEIFLALLKREYDKWIDTLNEIYEQNSKLTKENFAEKLANTIEKRKKLLKLVSMNMYEIEENSRLEELIEFKKSYGLAVRTVKKCVDKFLKDINEENKERFIYLFFPFMYGIYPYTESTEKQIEAMKVAKVPTKALSIYEIAYNGILKLLS